MKSSSSLGEYSGGVPQQAARSSVAGGESSSSDAVAAGRKVYAFEQGFCIIPEEDWIKGFKKAQGARFYVAGQRIAMVIPPRRSYPHLTLDLQEVYSLLKKPLRVKVRIAHAHYSPESGPTLAFHFRGVQLFPSGQFDRNILVRVQRYLERSPLPFRLAESVLMEQPETALVRAVEEIGLEASSSAPIGACQDPQEELSLVTSKRQESLRSPQPAKMLKGTGFVQSAPGAEAVANVVESAEDPKKIWRDTLNLDNFLEALDTLTVHQFNEKELGFAVIFYKLGVKNKQKRIDDYGDEVTKRGLAVLDALANSANFINKAAQQRGAREVNYRQAAGRSTLKSVESSQIKRGEETSTSLANQEALDYGLHQLVPSDLIDSSLQPASDNSPKFRGYQCAMLLLFRMLAMDYYQVRCQEFFSRTHYLCTHILIVCSKQASALEPYFWHMKTYLKEVQGEIINGGFTRRAKGDISVDLLKRHQDSIEPFREWYEQALQEFYQLTGVLADISNRLPAMTQRDWRHLINNTRTEMDRVATRDPKNQQHWQEAFRSIERMRDEFVSLVP